MKIVAFVFGGLCIVWFAILVAVNVIADYTYKREIGSYWDLSVKASTIQQKTDYLNQFVAALDGSSLAEYDAVFLKTPNNSVAANKIALKSLQGRMHSILEMNPSSFEYQQAMQQITGQEQNEAGEMLQVFEGAWWLEHHFFLWKWIGATYFIVVVLLGAASLMVGFELAE